MIGRFSTLAGAAVTTVDLLGTLPVLQTELVEDRQCCRAAAPSRGRDQPFRMPQRDHALAALTQPPRQL